MILIAHFQNRSRADDCSPELQGEMFASLQSIGPVPLRQSSDRRQLESFLRGELRGEQPKRRIYSAPGAMRGDHPLSWSGA